MENVIFRMQELMVQANSGALTNDEIIPIALEMEERLGELADLVNARDRDGDYLFAGFQSDQIPFVEVAGRYEYQGDEGVRYLQVSSTTRVAISESGKIFEDIPVANNTAIGSSIDGNTSGVEISQVSVTDTNQFDAVFPQDFVISFNDLDNVAPAAPNYTITRRSDGAIVAADQVYDVESGIDFNGLNVQLNGTPLPGEQFLVESSRSRDMLSTVKALVDNVASFTDDVEQQPFLQAADTDLNNILDRLSLARSRAGARLNTLDSTRDTIDSTRLNSQEILSEIRDLDYTEAVSNLTFLQYVLEASQKSFVSVSNLSLFNFL
jgi:flagellar hook-associated protein 3 FlgL